MVRVTDLHPSPITCDGFTSATSPAPEPHRRRHRPRSSGRAGAAGAEHCSLLLPQVLSGPGTGAGSCGPQEHGTPGCPPGEEPVGVSRAHPWHIHPGGKVQDPAIARLPFPPCRRAARRRVRWGCAELVPPALSHRGTYPALLIPAAGPGTGFWWHRGRR